MTSAAATRFARTDTTDAFGPSAAIVAAIRVHLALQCSVPIPKRGQQMSQCDSMRTFPLQFEKVLCRLASFDSLDRHFCFHCCKKKGNSSSLRILNCSTRISNIQNKLSLEMASKYLSPLLPLYRFISFLYVCFFCSLKGMAPNSSQRIGYPKLP